ncbi:MAG: NAD(P)/FAD-dependent oxidoreductase [Candidatus Asgardarchaeia archaeon]
MKVVIIGMGIGGVTAAEAIRKKKKDVEIVIYNQEPYYYYFRPWLIDLLAGRKSKEELFPHPPEWYEKRKIQVKLNARVIKINPSEKTIELKSGEKDNYDKLILATGSTPFVPPIKSSEKNGVFTLRSLDDTLKLVELTKRVKNAIVIGGGLLGLEMAYALKQRNLSVKVFEYFNRLLPRQLDDDGAKILQKKIEKLGVEVVTNARIAEILHDNGKVKGISFEDGKTFDGDVVLIAAGIRSNIQLARDAGLKVNRGVVVNEYLETSEKGIYAIGDLAETNGRVYGIIPAAIDQAKIVAKNILGNNVEYKGTIPSNTLHVMGIEVTSIGEAQPKEAEYEKLKNIDYEKGIYKKFVFKESKLVGLIMVGTSKWVQVYARLIRRGIDIGVYKEKLLNEQFNPTILLK